MAGVMQSYRATAVFTAAIAGLVTIAFARLPQLHLGYAWPAVRLALETSGSLIALFAAFLVFGRLRRRTYLNELLLACALAVLALSNLLFVTVPTVAGEAPDDLTVWAAPSARSLGALLFVLAVFAPRRELRRGGPVLALAAVATLTALGNGHPVRPHVRRALGAARRGDAQPGRGIAAVTARPSGPVRLRTSRGAALRAGRGRVPQSGQAAA
jgi:hypothetical protein